MLRETARAGTSVPARATTSAGGCALNLAAGLAALGQSVAHTGIRGRDAAGRTVADALRHHAVTDLALVRDDLSTGRYAAIIEPDGGLALAAAAMDAYAHAAELERHAPFREAASRADALVLDANGPPGAVRALARCRGPSTRLVLLATSAPKAPAIVPLMDEVDLLFSNADEWGQLATRWSRPPALAFVTRGPEGAAAFRDGSEVAARSAHGARVADVIGAGDAFAAGALAAWLDGAPDADALDRGLATAARCIARPGPLGWLEPSLEPSVETA